MGGWVKWSEKLVFMRFYTTRKSGRMAGGIVGGTVNTDGIDDVDDIFREIANGTGLCYYG